MAYLNTNEAHHDLKIGVLDGIKSNFPIEGKKQSIHLEGLDVRDGVMDPEDVAEQHTAKVEGKSWAAPVYGKLKMVNNDTGETVDTKEMKLAEVPRMTKRYSYIVDGNELQVDNQWQLKPGVYARRRRNGKLETRFNLANKASFHVTLDPEKKQFLMERGKSKAIPVYPLMKEMGIDDDTLEKKWGKEVFSANKTGRNVATALERFYKADKKRAPKDTTEAREYFHQVMRDSKLRPEATELTLGKGFKQVEGDTFTRATKKMIDVLGGAPEDERDSLAFKELRTTADYAKDKLTEWRTQKTIRQKATRKINHATNIREVIKSDTFGDAVKSTFTKNALARTADQVNPVEMISSSFQTTVMGPGGIQSEQSINDETKLINSSHLGFLDPIHTPEGSKTGVSLHLPLGVKKVGNTPTVPVYNLKTGKPERINPTTFHKSKVVMPDQVKWKDGRPIPVSETVQVSGRGNEVAEDKFKNADYTMQDSSQLFSMTSNLIPWLGSNSGNRASYADSQISQAISLKHREAPLVQVGTRSDLKGAPATFEGFMGKQSAHSSPIDGQVVAVSKNAVTIKGGDGKKRKVGLYNNFPLNDPKAVLDSTARVKKGDAVKKGQVVADNNFTQNGELALGTNLQAAYIPFKGLNFEDGVSISESAAKKMTSVHMHKPDIQLADTAVTDPKQYRIHHPEAFTKDQYERVDKNGVAKVGQRVLPGDPLVLATKPYELKGRMGIRSVRKSLSTQQSDNALRWKSDHPGEVVGVHKDKKGNVTVHVKTEEPMQVGDKVAGRHGNKGIVTSIIPDNEMPIMPNGKSIDIALNPSGVPGRMNMGQVFETVAGKIAQKTGKPYVVKNFEYGVDQLEKIQGELKKHGLSDTEELKDPKSGQSLGKALVGPQHMLKLNFQIDKKISARAGNPLEGSEPEYYDPSTLIPSGGGKTGGQSIGNLDLYALLAHGAKANIREMQTWKSEGPDTRGEGSRWDSQHNEVWRNIQNGDPIPPPKKTFAFQKFEDMLRASGVNVEKKGHRIQISPLLDSQVLKMSAGELKDPSALTYSKLDKNGEPVPRPGGLFDTRMTGGHGGKKWTHMKLAEPMPNPVFEPAVMKVLGMPKKDYHAVVQGDKAVKNGKLVPLETPGSKAGGAAIVDMLGKVDVDKELKKSQLALNQLKLPENLAHRENTPKLDTAMKKVRYLSTLKKLDMSPKDAYSINNLPIIPPAMRPASVLPDGNVHWADLNGLYSQMGQINGKMKDPRLRKYMGDKDLKDKRAEMYDGLKALVGVGGTYADRQGDDKGVLLQLHGKEPKKGFFQGTLLKRRQDMSMRSTITPDPGMGIDNVGLPEEKALTLFRPFVTKKMVDLGAARDPLAAQDMLAKKKKDKMVYKALDAVMQERPVLLKRDPVLHKHSVQAFNAHRVPGRAIQIHPLVTGGYNADFDGDSCDLDTPLVLRVAGKVCMPTGRMLEALFKPESGNYVLELQKVETLTYSGWSKVQTLSFHEVRDKRKFKVTLKNGINFIVSEDHSLMQRRQEVKPTQLTVDTELDRQCLPMTDGTRTYAEGVLFGHFLGDGSVDERRVSVACKPVEERRYLVDIWEHHFGCHVYDSEYGYFQVNRVEIAEQLYRLCGRYCSGKYVSYELFEGGEEFLKGLLAGYILADGSVEFTKSGSFLVRTWSRSKRLRDEMSAVAHMLGLPHSIRERRAKGEVNYIISFGKEAIKLFDYRCPGKKGDLIRLARDAYENNRKDSRRSQSERGYEISSIEEVKYNDRMIDLEVEGDHVFAIQGGVILHNTMSAFVPISKEAVEEAKGMMPSSNLFNAGSGDVAYTPTLESNLGLYKMSMVTGDGKKRFKNPTDALKAARDGKTKVTDLVSVGGKKTTAGRIMLASAVPEGMQNQMLYDTNLRLDKKGIKKAYTQLAKDHRSDFGESASNLMKLGYDASYGSIKVRNPETKGTAFSIEKEAEDPKKNVQFLPMGTHSFSLDDFKTDKKTRDPLVAQARKKIAQINSVPGLSSKERRRRSTGAWFDATEKMKKVHTAKMERSPNNLYMMNQAGVKPGWDQYQQIKLAPMLLVDAKNEIIPTPVTKSYSEGLDVGSYWTQQSGARRGVVQKVQEVAGPGAFTKQLMNTSMGLVVNEDDCGTRRGITLKANSNDIYDRELNKDMTVKGKTFKAGTIMTPDVVGHLRAADKKMTVPVRSALKCEHGKGICQKCAGLAPDGSYFKKGTNVGVLATQSLGERSTQLAMKAFHSGGIAKRHGGTVRVADSFKRVLNLTELPKEVPNAARLSMKAGKVDKIERDPLGVNVWVGGQKHHVPKDPFGNPLHQPMVGATTPGWKPPKIGMKVEAGQPLSDPTRTFVNPHDLYKATGNMEVVQNHLVNELHGIYGNEGVRRQHTELVVKGMSDLTRVTNPGDADHIVRGEYQSASQVRAMNKGLASGGRKPVQHTPILKGISITPLEVQEDWMAKLNHRKLRQTIAEGAMTGASSHLHGEHPVPGMAYGAEFGMTEKHKFQKPHLKDVPKWAY